MKQVELAVRARLEDMLRPAGLTALQYTAMTVLEGMMTEFSAPTGMNTAFRPAARAGRMSERGCRWDALEFGTRVLERFRATPERLARSPGVAFIAVAAAAEGGDPLGVLAVVGQFSAYCGYVHVEGLC